MNAVAAVFSEPNFPLELKSIPLPQLGEGEAIVEVDCCTLCGSDLHSISGARSVPTPTILGHEIMGHVSDVCGIVRDLNDEPISSGDRICWSVTATCGCCYFCSEGPPQKCDQLFKYGHEELTDKYPLSGGLASHCHLIPGTAILKVPDTLPDVMVSPAGCATATVAAALRTAGNCEGRTVVIHGAGMLGLTTAAMARSRGAANVIVTDLVEQRLSRAESFGATHSSLNELSEITAGRGADIVVDMSGSPDAMESSVNQLRIGGRLVLVGAVFPSRPLSLHGELLVRKMLCVQGVHNYQPDDLRTALEFLSESGHEYPFAALVDREFSLEQINEAIAYAQGDESFRVAVRPRANSKNT